MTIGSRHLALPIAVAALSLAAPLASAASDESRAADAKNRPAAVRVGLGTARSLGRPNGCAKRIPPGRAKRMTKSQRRGLARRLRSCRRRLATKSTVPSGPLYWGASIGDQLTGTQAPWDMDAVAEFERLAGKQLSLVNFFAPFANCASSPCYFYEFPAGPMDNIRAHGAIPVFSWSSQSIPSSLSEPDFQLSDVIAGSYDDHIREFAEDARDWGHPFFLRFNWEMNGNWFPWSEGVNGNGTGEYVAAWRHVHDIFVAVGATNATWVWCPNIDPGGKLQSVDSLYPGDAYVDWTGLDGYNWGPKKGDSWTSFDRLYDATYHRIAETIAPSKPMLIGEVGTSETGGSKAEWISEALATIPAEYPQVRGMLWFDTYDSGMDWPIETSQSAASAFAVAIQDPAYRGNSFGDLGAGPIAPPN